MRPTLQSPTDLTTIPLDAQRALLPPCAICGQPATALRDGAPVCTPHYLAPATRRPARSRALPWLLVAALVVALLVWGLAGGLLALALPPIRCAKCQYCGAETWPGIYTCASCRKSR